MESFEVKILTTPEYLKVLKSEQKITFAVFVHGKEVHHQISITEYDTREKIEKKMAEVGAQVYEELSKSGNHRRGLDVPEDIQSLINDHRLK